MLRAVGHVLEHETENSTVAAVRAAAQRWWNNLKQSEPEPAIVWQFIYDDRNALLNEYSFTPTDSPGRLVRLEGKRPGYEMVLSPFIGRDARDVVEEAIQWWDQQLQAIELATT